MTTFSEYLAKQRKPNGDKLLPKTIHNYEYYYKQHSQVLDNTPENELVDATNEILAHTPNPVLRAMLRQYLLHRGMKQKEITKELDKTIRHATSFSSKRFLQTQLLTREEITILYNHASDDTIRLAILMLYDTGCRREELLNVRLGDIKKPTPEEEEKGIYGILSVMGKGAKKRTVYIGKTSARELGKYILKHQLKKEDYVIHFYTNNRPNTDQGNALWGRINRLGKKFLDREIHPHCFRHSKATHMADLGADPLDVKEYLGHESINTTQVYIHASSHRGKQAFEKYTEDIGL